MPLARSHHFEKVLTCQYPCPATFLEEALRAHRFPSKKYILSRLAFLVLFMFRKMGRPPNIDLFQQQIFDGSRRFGEMSFMYIVETLTGFSSFT